MGSVAPSSIDLAPASAGSSGATPYGPLESALVLELLPIPAAVVQVRDGAVEFEAVNRAFRHVGLGSIARNSPLIQAHRDTIIGFLESDARGREFDWQLGDAVDSRHFRIRLARRPNERCGRCLVSLIDHTAEMRTEHSLRREMQTDSLTGLLNRAGFSDLLEATTGNGEAPDYAVLAINLDRFSRVNACLGSLAGDELLISVARRMKGALRAHDRLARTGGDEFAILMRAGEGLDDALQVARRIEEALATPFRLSDFKIRVECAVGIALGGDDIVEAEDLIRHAQFAVKRAKATGRTEIYHSRTFDLARRQFSIETELRHAIDSGEMRLHFQPITDLATGRMISFEALARWRNARGVELSPVDFIPVAEECGLIVPLGRWAMHEAARVLADWDRRAGGSCGVSVSVNLSAIQLQRDHVPDLVRGALDANGLAPDRLMLELTESAIVSDPDRIAQTMHALKGLGTRLAMDDFGTGYSNLAYLQKLPIDVLKIDRSFISGLLADRDKVSIVRAILSLASALGMETTAEGVETVELAQTLTALGCTYGQGYLYAKPLAADQAYTLLSASRS